nr:unnamed protein product [Callosobruchus analis]
MKQLECSIKTSLSEVKTAFEDYNCWQKKREHESGVVIFGIPEVDPRTLTETIAKFFSSKLKLDVGPADINVCYRMGASAPADKSGKRPRPVAVYFVNRWLRDKIFFAKSALKGSGAVISEIRTESALELYKKIKTVVGAKNVWTWRGNIFTLKNNNKILVSSLSDVTK